jgi:uncharacterized protein YndB with AHSA1/START domain
MPHDASRKVVWAERLVPASPDRIFDLLTDPAQHGTFDGSGTVVAARRSAPSRLSMGAKFGMDMRIGLPYRMTNTVVEFDEGTRIGWRHVGGHVWRYVLSPVAGGTMVREEFDYSTNRAPLLLALMRAIPTNERSIERTLDNLARHFGADA